MLPPGRYAVVVRVRAAPAFQRGYISFLALFSRKQQQRAARKQQETAAPPPAGGSSGSRGPILCLGGGGGGGAAAQADKGPGSDGGSDAGPSTLASPRATRLGCLPACASPTPPALPAEATAASSSGSSSSNRVTTPGVGSEPPSLGTANSYPGLPAPPAPPQQQQQQQQQAPPAAAILGLAPGQETAAAGAAVKGPKLPRMSLLGALQSRLLGSTSGSWRLIDRAIIQQGAGQGVAAGAAAVVQEEGAGRGPAQWGDVVVGEAVLRRPCAPHLMFAVLQVARRAEHAAGGAPGGLFVDYVQLRPLAPGAGGGGAAGACPPPLFDSL